MLPLPLPGISQATASHRWNPLTHTFVAVTGDNSKVAHTYSWGDSANVRGWNKDQPLDMRTAQEAINNDLAEKVGDSTLDAFVSKAFNNLNKPENEHGNGILFCNCKMETQNLVGAARNLRAVAIAAAATASAKGYDSVTVNKDGTATGTYTPTGSRIERSVTCDSEGHCTSH
jgi:hypothetical protein